MENQALTRQAARLAPLPRPRAALGSVLRRRRWWLLLLFAAGWTATVAMRWVLPARYDSHALLLVEQQSVPVSYVEPNVTFDPNQLLQSMGEQVLSLARLEDVVQRLHLYPSLARRRGQEAAAEQLRAAIAIQPVGMDGLPAPAQGPWSAVGITARAAAPDLAQQIATSVTTDFIQEDLSATQQASDRTTAFLQEQVQHASAAVAAAEAQIRTYESRHLGMLPGQDAANLALGMNLQSELDSAQSAQEKNQQEVATDQLLLAQAPTPRETQLRSQLNTLQAQLHQLLGEGYTERYPDVVETRGQIAVVEAALAAPAGAAGAGTGAASASAAELQSRLQAAQAAQPRLQAQVGVLQSELQTYQRRLSEAPLPAAELNQLNQQLQQAQAGYQGVLAKWNASQMASQLQQRQGGAQFQLVNPPDLPREAAWPNLSVLCWLGLAVGLGAGLAASALAEILQPVVTGEAELMLLGLGPVMAHIPPLRSPVERWRRGWRHGFELAAAVVLLGAMAAANIWLLWGR